MQWPNDKDWALHKHNIWLLYIGENLPLKEVIVQMRSRHGFKGTPKMYKSRLALWGFTKYKKRVGKPTENEDVSSVTVSSSSPLSVAAVRRAFSSRTVSPATLQSPLPPSVGESIFRLVSGYYRASCDTKLWYTCESGRFTTSKDVARSASNPDKFVGFWTAGLSFAKERDFKNTRQSLSNACELIPTMVLAEHPATMRAILELLLLYNREGYYELAQLVLQQIYQMAGLYLCHSHPLSNICTLFLRVEPSELDELFE
ncbi:predicted protein [Uncinocarpus reesii 1704]|uniref:Clr5 domain-containing protein n=1 Tax=Uncinocarpus reesii (strain UAMH 1704) TaxID=336963 RepID=C4JH33_UNCRE|nr:uncharacterized protein UREG_01284 [Uncinocarpus reesii 1704]EEP76435.1 predicted protein [Uncinocarpus reesii 1704]